MASSGRFLLVVLWCLCSIPFPSRLYGAEIPDAGSLLGQQRRPPSSLPDSLPRFPSSSEEQSDTTTEMALRLTVKGYRFEGIDGLATEEELQGLLDETVGKEMGLAELRQIAEKVGEYLRGKGFFLARAMLPAQDVTSGIITISVTAGRVEDDVEVRGKGPIRLHATMLKRMIEAAVPSGQVLQGGSFERSLLLINDLPGISAKATLEKGRTAGGTRIFLDVIEGPLLATTLAIDNHGNRYTGIMRGSASLIANDPFGIGDQISTTVVAGEDTAQGVLACSLQLLPNGLKGSMSYTGLAYRLGEELENLDAYGYANTLATSLAYPLLRRRAVSLWTSLAYEYRMLDDFSLDTHIRERDLHVLTLDLAGNHTDSFAGGGLGNFRIALTGGDLRLGVEANAQADAATAQTSGEYAKIAYSLSRLQRVSGAFALFLALNGQVAGSNLDSSEKFTLGGPNSIRAYPVGEASGDSGHGITTELRYDLPFQGRWGNLQLVSFLDAGHVTLHHSTWENSVNTADNDNRYWLGGAGLGINLGSPGRYGLRLAWAHTIDDNPGRSLAGYDADNRSSDNRLWLKAILWF